MKFHPLAIPGAWLLEPDPIEDERGFFARTVCADEFAAHGLDAGFVQQSVSWNRLAGTLRGLHFQCAPHEEAKLVRVTRGAIYDVIVDLRTASPAHGRWTGIRLDAGNRHQLYIPPGVAHGFQTLADDTEILYQMTVPFHPESARGIRWDDPDLAIAWPDCPERIVSAKDRALPRWKESA